VGDHRKLISQQGGTQTVPIIAGFRAAQKTRKDCSWAVKAALSDISNGAVPSCFSSRICTGYIEFRGSSAFDQFLIQDSWGGKYSGYLHIPKVPLSRLRVIGITARIWPQASNKELNSRVALAQEFPFSGPHWNRTNLISIRRVLP